MCYDVVKKEIIEYMGNFEVFLEFEGDILFLFDVNWFVNGYESY